MGAGISPAGIRDFYLERGPRVFGGNNLLRKARRWATAKYNPERLRQELETILGTTRLGESRTRLVIPSMDVNSGTIHLWKTAHAARFVQDYKQPMIEAAMATAAAPSFFRPHLTPTGTPLIDGGVFANNPAALAAVEAIGVLNWPRDDVAILSLGTGAEALDIDTRPWWRSGIVGLASKLSTLLMASQSNASCGMATHLLDDRERFVRINPNLPNGRYGLDVTSELHTLSAHGHKEARHELQRIEPLFLTTRAQPFVPDHEVT